MQAATPRATEAGEPNSPALDHPVGGTFAPFLRALRRDFARGLGQRELWLYLGWRDVRKHYRRTVLGPFWLTLSMGVLVAGLGVLYSQIFQTPITDYLPYIAVGFIVWTLIGTSLNGACTVIIQAAGSIRQVPLPFSVYLLQFAWAQLIAFGHNFVIYLLLVVIFRLDPWPSALLFLPALVLLLLNVIFGAMILGPLCARFRDVPMIVASVVQVAFFMTPIIWSADQLPERAFFVGLNPFYHYLEITRDPLLGEIPALSSWIVCIVLTTLLGTFATFFFARFRARLAYWA
jgi:ABC-2 type transport system permease protein/lipopolysaccharide transport system permease protein